MSNRRLICFFSISLLSAFILLINIFFININTKYSIAAEKQAKSSIELDKGRADIFDCNFVQLTSNEKENFALATTGQDAYIEYFELMDTKEQAKAYELFDSKKPYLLPIKETQKEKNIFTKPKRYLDEPVAPNLIGYLNGDGTGAQGVEQMFDEILSQGGTKTQITYYKAALGELLNSYKPYVLRKQGTGNSVALTIDMGIQRICEGIAATSIKKGAIVVMESKTGKIKASVSMPKLDPNDIATSIKNDDTALINRTTAQFNVGSVLKPLIGALIKEKGFDTEEIFYCKGYLTVDGHTFTCYNGNVHGEVDLEKALMKSCNTYFINYGLQIPGKDILEYLNAAGFSKQIKQDNFKVTTKGTVPSLEKITKSGEKASICFGQGMLTASPIQITSYMNIFANKGKYISPSVIEGIYNQNTKSIITSFYNPLILNAVQEKTADTIKKYLISTVQEGLSKNATPNAGGAAGKTGTAQTGRYIKDEYEIKNSIETPVDETVAWFSGFYPQENPKYTVTIMLDGYNIQGEQAALLFADICNELIYYDTELMREPVPIKDNETV